MVGVTGHTFMQQSQLTGSYELKGSFTAVQKAGTIGGLLGDFDIFYEAVEAVSTVMCALYSISGLII